MRFRKLWIVFALPQVALGVTLVRNNESVSGKDRPVPRVADSCSKLGQYWTFSNTTLYTQVMKLVLEVE